MGFGSALTILAILLRLGNGIWERFFSPSATLKRWEEWAIQRKTRTEDERARLKAEEERIDKEPPKTGQDLVDELNKKFGEGEEKKP